MSRISRSVITDEISQDFEAACDLAMAFQFEGVEIRSAWDTAPHELTDSQIARMRSITAERELEMSGFCSPGFKCAIPTTKAEENAAVDTVQRSLVVASKLGDLPVRLFPFYRDGDPDPRRAGGVAASLIDRVECAPGVRIRFENGMRTNAPTLKYLKCFLDEADFKIPTGVLWDPGNGVFSGYDIEPFPHDYWYLADLIEHVHVKDPLAQARYVRLGDGSLPWERILKALRSAGFEGHVSLETHWRVDRVLLPEERDEPWRRAISHGGFEASSECMRILNEMLGAPE